MATNPNDIDMDEMAAAWSASLAEQAEAEAKAKNTSSSAATATKPGQIFQSLSDLSNAAGESSHGLDLIMDIPVQITVELGRTKMTIKDLLQLAQGSVIELNGMAGEPMDVLVNGCLIAQGEVVVVNDKFGIRLTNITSAAERIKKLSR
jgi:flagellar motor switch protein FliN/FliY